MWPLETLIILNEKALSLYEQNRPLSSAYRAIGINSSVSKLESFDSKTDDNLMETKKHV